VTGDDLIQLASRLAANPGLGDAEARYRSAASRAYYGAFHLARAFLADLGARLLKNATGHAELYRVLLSSGQSDAQNAARLLSDLRRNRNAADYDLDSARFRKQSVAFEIVESADQVRELLDRCRQEPALSEIRGRLSSS
jgi:uncharacterized protein (UPF0332 family)